jgi:hypothetical protein
LMINAGRFDELKMFRPVEILNDQRDSLTIYESENNQMR